MAVRVKKRNKVGEYARDIRDMTLLNTVISYQCITPYNKYIGLKQPQFIIAQFLWIRVPGMF